MFRAYKSVRPIGAALTLAVTSAAFAITQNNHPRNNPTTQLNSNSLCLSENMASMKNAFQKTTGATTTQCESVSATYEQDARDLEGLISSTSATWHYKKMKEPERFQDDHAIYGTLLKNKNIQSYHIYKRAPTLSENGEEPHTIMMSEPIIDDFATTYIVKNGVRNPVDSSVEKKQGYPEDTELVLGAIKIGSKLEGHDGIVHGGIISLLFDDVMGFAYEAMGDSPTLSPATSSSSPNKREIHPTDDQGAFAVTANLSIDFRSPLWQKDVDKAQVLIRIYHAKTEGRKVYLKGKLTNLDGSVVYTEAQSLYIWMKPKKQK